VQSLLRRVVVRSDPALSARFPGELPCRVRVELGDGRVLVHEKSDYLGFWTRPMPWQAVRSKFDALSARRLCPAQQAGIADAVSRLEDLTTADLCARLGSSLDPRRSLADAGTPEATP
jgi:2-methylcitrate dehydratase